MDSRTKNGTRNILSGLINRLLLILLPFIIRTILINELGSEYLGLNSLFASILTVLNIAELGFGSALVYSMYKPIAEKNDVTVCALLSLYKKIYFFIGVIILSVGLILTPFVPKLISGTIPGEINIYVLYIIYLVNTSFSYLFFAHRRALLVAYQRNDVITNINSILSIILYLVQAIVLIWFKDYYLYLIIMPVFTIAENIIVAKVSYNRFPNISCVGNVSKKDRLEIKNHVKGLALQNICSASRNSFDSIIISLYLGLASIAIYNNYYFIMNAVHTFIYQIPNSIRASVGNSIVSENIRKNFKIFNTMTLLYQWLSGWCLVCLFCLFQPFMKIWMGESMLCSNTTVILLCVYFFELCMSDIIVLYKDGAGLWWHGRYRTIIEAIANLFLNFLLGWIFGLNGIIIATIITMTIIGHGYGGYIVFHYYFVEESYVKYIFTQLKYLVISFGVAFITYFICSNIVDRGIVSFIYKIIICIIVPNLLFLFIYKHSRYFEDSKQLIIRMILPFTKKNK